MTNAKRILQTPQYRKVIGVDPGITAGYLVEIYETGDFSLKDLSGLESVSLINKILHGLDDHGFDIAIVESQSMKPGQGRGSNSTLIRHAETCFATLHTAHMYAIDGGKGVFWTAATKWQKFHGLGSAMDYNDRKKAHRAKVIELVGSDLEDAADAYLIALYAANLAWGNNWESANYDV